MAKQIIWSLRADSERIEILKYWNKRNKSTVYSKKLNFLFKEAIKLISIYPKIGKQTDDNIIRVKIVKDYLIFYELTQDNQIIILTIWDSKRDVK